MTALFDGGQGVVDFSTKLERVRRDDRCGHVGSQFGLSQGSPECDSTGSDQLAGLNQGSEEL